MMYNEIVLTTGVNPLKMLDMSCFLRLLPLVFYLRNSTYGKTIPLGPFLHLKC